MNDPATAVLQLGSADWAALVDIDSILREAGSPLSAAARKVEVHRIALELFDEGLVALGEMTSSGFEPWPSNQRERLAEIIDREDWTYAAWLCNTDLGDKRAEEHGTA